jgi:hypothetical protein
LVGAGLGFALLLRGGPALTQASDICTPLAQVAKQVATPEALAGKPIDATRWETKIPLPGAGKCTVERSTKGELSYSCKLEGADRAAAMTQAVGLARRIRDTCAASGVRVFQDETAQPSTGDFASLLGAGVGDGALVSVNLMTLLAMVNGEIVSKPTVVVSVFASRQTARATPAAAGAPAASAPSTGQTLGVEQAAFCKDVKRLQAEGVGGFAGVLGPKVRSVYDTTYRMAGSDRCYVGQYDSGRRYHHCRLMTTPALVDASKAADRVTVMLQKCLAPATVAVRRRPRDDGAFVLEYTPSDIKLGEMTARVSTSLDDEWTLAFDVEQPE